MSVDFSPLEGLGKFEFYLVRHGMSEGNHKDLVQGRLDFALSELGREQARLTGEWFRDKPAAFVLATPLARGRSTAEIISETAGLPPPEPLPELVELDTGVFTGLSLGEAKERHPRVWSSFMEKSWEGVDGAESIRELSARAETAWAILVSRLRLAVERDPAAPRSCIAVAHAGILQWLIKVTIGSTSWFPLFPMGNCGIYLFSVENRVTRWEKLNVQASGVSGSRSDRPLQRSAPYGT